VRIAFVAASQVPSTTANSIQVVKVCQGFAQLGHEVHLILPGQKGIPWDELAAQYGLITPFAIHWIGVHPRWRRYDLAWKALRQALALQVDLVYTRMLQAGALSLYRISGRIGPLLFRMCLHSRIKKRWLPITRALLGVLEKDFKMTFPPGSAIVSPDGVDLERFTALPGADAARQQLGLPPMPTAVYAGSFYAGRGMQVLFALAQTNPQVSFLWVGGKPADVAFWQEEISRAGLRNVVLTGFVPNTAIPTYLAAADILLMPYGRTTAASGGGNIADYFSPLKMFEYMAAGRAILSSDLPVLHEVLNSSNAVFCQPEVVSDWIQAFSALIAEPDRRSVLARQALQDANQYSWQVRAQRSLEGF
jgi:glycosyltransferase involved in cell wall biosynthesis